MLRALFIRPVGLHKLLLVLGAGTILMPENVADDT